jgi:hypothetical protein
MILLNIGKEAGINMAANVLQLTEVGDYEARNLNMNTNVKTKQKR